MAIVQGGLVLGNRAFGAGESRRRAPAPYRKILRVIDVIGEFSGAIWCVFGERLGASVLGVRTIREYLTKRKRLTKRKSVGCTGFA